MAVYILRYTNNTVACPSYLLFCVYDIIYYNILIYYLTRSYMVEMTIINYNGNTFVVILIMNNEQIRHQIQNS